MRCDTTCVCSPVNDFVTSEAEAFSNLVLMKNFKASELRQYFF